MLRTSLITIRQKRPALSCRTSPERPTSHRDNPSIFGAREYNFFFKQLQTDPHKKVIEKNPLFSTKENREGQGGAVTLVSAFLCERSFLCKKKQRGSRGCGPPDLSFSLRTIFSLRKETARVKGARSPSSQLFFANDLFSAKRNSGDQGDAVLLISAFLSIFSLQKETAGVKGAAPPLVSAFLCLLSFLCEKKVSQWRERGLRLECRSPSERLGSFAPGTGSGS